MPDTFGCEHLIEYMLRIGPGMQSVAGLIPIDFNEICSWVKLTSIPLSGQESEIIRDLSRIYIAQSNESTAADSVQPWAKGVTDIDKFIAEQKMKFIVNESMGDKPEKKLKQR